MYRTVFELLVSVKLFLGRFDMRTMQVSKPSKLHAIEIETFSVQAYMTSMRCPQLCSVHGFGCIAHVWHKRPQVTGCRV